MRERVIRTPRNGEELSPMKFGLWRQRRRYGGGGPQSEFDHRGPEAPYHLRHDHPHRHEPGLAPDLPILSPPSLPRGWFYAYPEGLSDQARNGHMRAQPVARWENRRTEMSRRVPSCTNWAPIGFESGGRRPLIGKIVQMDPHSVLRASGRLR